MKPDIASIFTGGDLDLQMKTALKIFDSEDINDFSNDSYLISCLRKSIKTGNRSAASILLLGYDSSEESVEILSQLKHDFGKELTKLKPWSQPIEVSLVVEVSMSKLGVGIAHKALLERISLATENTLVFCWIS